MSTVPPWTVHSTLQSNQLDKMTQMNQMATESDDSVESDTPKSAKRNDIFESDDSNESDDTPQSAESDDLFESDCTA